VAQLCIAQSGLLKDGNLRYDSTTTFLIELSGDRSDISNSLNRDLIQKLVFGGHINSELKDGVKNRLDRENYYRGSMSPRISLSFFPDSSKYGFSASYSYTNIINLWFRDDLFNLVFYGNKQLGTNKTYIAPSNLKYENYQSLSFGIVEKQSGSFLNLGIYDGIAYKNYKLGSTTFLTEYANIENSEIAEKIYLDAKYSEFIESSNAYKPFGNGIGVGISGAYNFQTANHKIQVSARDVGVIYWKNLTVRDTSGNFEFDGFNFNLKDEGSLNNGVESLIDSIIPGSKTKNAWILLPGYVRIDYYAPAEKRFFVSARILHYYTRDNFTEFSADLNMKYGKQNFLWLTGGFGGYGGYGGYMFGLGTEFSIFNHGIVRIGSRHALGLLDGGMPASNVYFQYAHRL